MPHTWIVWVYAQIVHSHIATQEMSAIRSPSLMKTSTFSIQDCENTFNMSSSGAEPNDTTNLENISETNNTLQGIVRVDYKKITSCALQKVIKYEVLFIIYRYNLSYSSCTMRSSHSWSVLSNVARCSLSISKTPITSLLRQMGTTISLRESELQAICPGNLSTSSTT